MAESPPSLRYASANNPHLDDFDPNEANNYITYLDANSLYATAQSEPLPVGNFQFLSDEEICRFDLHSVAPDADTGYIIECDLEYPAHLHDLHNDYPMAPEHLTVTRDMLSPFASSLLDDSRHPWMPTQKLVPNLLNKTKYVTHYRNLQLYVKHGLKVTKIHRIISFDQSPWLKSWIDHCNKQRREATSDFHSDLAKLQAVTWFFRTTSDKKIVTSSAPTFNFSGPPVCMQRRLPARAQRVSAAQRSAYWTERLLADDVRTSRIHHRVHGNEQTPGSAAATFLTPAGKRRLSLRERKGQLPRVPAILMNWLQPARLILHKRKYDHITSDIRDRLHWLPIQQRLEYKICLLIFKCLHQMAPVYLTVIRDPVSASASRSHLRSALHSTRRFGGTSIPNDDLWTKKFFRLWSVTVELVAALVRDPSLTMTQFCTHLKTFLFRRAYCT